MDTLKAALVATIASAPTWIKDGFKVGNDSTRRSAFEVLRLAGVTITDMATLVPEVMTHSARIRDRVGIEAVYAPYVQQQAAAMKVFQKDENLKLPLDLDYDQIHGLSIHEKSLLRETRPESVGQARRIEGMTPSGTLRLLAHVQSRHRTAARAAIFDEVASRKRVYMVN